MQRLTGKTDYGGLSARGGNTKFLPSPFMQQRSVGVPAEVCGREQRESRDEYESETAYEQTLSCQEVRHEEQGPDL